jgi:hypothetical protein
MAELPDPSIKKPHLRARLLGWLSSGLFKTTLRKSMNPSSKFALILCGIALVSVASAAQPVNGQAPAPTTSTPRIGVVSAPTQHSAPSADAQHAMEATQMGGTAGKPAPLTPIQATLTSLSAFPVAVGGQTTLTVTGTGNCRFRLTHELKESPLAPQPMMIYNSSMQSPFPMSLKMIEHTPAGNYVWTANGIEGCTGNASIAVSVK